MIKSGKIIFEEVSCRSQIGCEKIWTILGKFFLERNSKTRTKSEVKIREEVDKKQKVTSIESLQFKKYAKKKEFSCC